MYLYIFFLYILRKIIISMLNKVRKMKTSTILFFIANPCNNVQTFVLKRPTVFSRSLIFEVAFMSLYSIGIALYKVKASIFSSHTFVSNIKLNFGPICVHNIKPFITFIFRMYLTLKEIKHLVLILFRHV